MAADPRIYLACALSSVPASERINLESDCLAINRAVVSAALDADPTWCCSVHAPITHSAPWLDTRDEDSIWEDNTREVICDSDSCRREDNGKAPLELAGVNALPGDWLRYLTEPPRRQHST